MGALPRHLYHWVRTRSNQLSFEALRSIKQMPNYGLQLTEVERAFNLLFICSLGDTDWVTEAMFALHWIEPGTCKTETSAKRTVTFITGSDFHDKVGSIWIWFRKKCLLLVKSNLFISLLHNSCRFSLNFKWHSWWIIASLSAKEPYCIQ